MEAKARATARASQGGGGRPGWGGDDARRQVLETFFSKASRDAYNDVAGVKPGTPPAPGAQQSLAQDRAAASGAGIEMNVFSIRLGEPLLLPRCSPITLAAVANGVQRTCLFPIVVAGAAAGVATSASGSLSTMNVAMSSADQPDWMTGSLQVTEMGDTPVAVTWTDVPSRQEDTTEARLTAKYRRAPVKGPAVVCRNGLGIVTGAFSDRTWSMPGLRVVYHPVSLLCDTGTYQGMGEVRFETETYQRLHHDTEARHEASQPRL